MSQGSFTPHRTLGSRDNPRFAQPIHYQQQDRDLPALPRARQPTAGNSQWDSQTDSAASVNKFYVPSLSDIGDSSSLFSNTPPTFDFTRGNSTTDTESPNSSRIFKEGHRQPESPASYIFGPSEVDNQHTESPIPFVFGASTNERKLQKPRGSKMVNERSPAKAPLHPVVRNEQPPKMADNAYPAKPQSSVPQFGQPTLPHSPLNRAQHQPQFGQPTMPNSPLNRSQYQPQPKQSSMFIQPKSRPEHHRDAPAHPHLQAVKDATRKVIDPFLPRAPAVYNTSSQPSYPVPAPAPTYAAPSYTNTKAAAPPSFGSSGNTYGGFSSINTNNGNYVDLTRNEYRTSTIPDPFTFVDPAKAQEDLKALLEGVMEDEDDVPRTRSRKKRKDAEVDDLTSKLKGLDVEEEKLDVASEDEEDDGSVEGIKVKLLPHQIEGLEWMIGRELGTAKKGRVPKGGILADDMGLGKTLQSISLILSNAKPTEESLIAQRKLPTGVEKCTLVVAPLALIRQWEVEIKDKVTSSHSLRVMVHHGPQRTKRFQDLKRYDVVITTYQILVSEFGNSSTDEDGIKVGCFGLHWYRVILDEAHSIKNRNAKATKACYALRSEYRWCLTGTPMQNNLEELQSLIKFLRIKPYDDLREFKEQIDQPMKRGRGDLAIKRLRAVLKIFMKRRTKDILTKEGALNPGGKPSAPGQESSLGFKVTQRKIEKISAEFSPEERHFYERLEQRTDLSIEQMMNHQEKVNYASALVLLLRLRQACNHPKLVAGKIAKDGEALSLDASASTQAKAKSASKEVDEMAEMFGAMGVESRKCEVCQLELGKTAIAEGAIRCLDCEADLEAVGKKHKSRKEKKDKTKKKKKKHVKSEATAVARKPRNRAIITDSDDEDEKDEGSWVVPEAEQGALKLGKAGGMADENAEGGGEWLNSDDDDTFPDIQDLGITSKKPIKLDDSDSDSGSGSEEDDDDVDETDSDEEVEDEFQSDSDEEAQLATVITSTKISRLISILGKEVAEHKFIVFSQFTSMLDLIEPFLRQKGFKFTRYDGKMKNDDREASLGRLRNDKSCRILLCSLKCGSLGLNLTAATRVVILEPFWNPFVEEQAIDRVHRLTQKIDVIVYKITIADTVEERILDLQEKKRELANQTIEGGKGAGGGKLTMKDLLNLFKRDAEHTVPGPAAAQYDLGAKPRILKEGLTGSGSGKSSRDVSVTAPRKVTPPTASSAKEDSVYGRRW